MRLNYFNFKEINNSILMTNDFGKYIFVSRDEFKTIINQTFISDSQLTERLLNSKMIYDETAIEFTAKNRYDIRELKNHLNIATSLHIFVVTTECNMACVYCQANNGRQTPHMYMSEETAKKAVDIALQSPTRYLSFEFQGGEPLLNFKTIKAIVEYAEGHKAEKEIYFNVVSNLTLLTDEMLSFFAEHKFGISTSLDGNETVHNKNRVYKNGNGTFKDVCAAIDRVKSAGICVGAIETTTKNSLKYPREIVRAYRNLGFDNIFIRPLTPLGKATVNWETIGYAPEEFVSFYKEACDELISINKNGTFFKENHASILLGRIDGRNINYMELRSPCGAGIGQLAYYADGNIFTCDEGRMFYEMGDNTFRLGTIDNTYQELINNGVCRTVCAASVLETIPSCCDCVYQSYCGTCPVVNYAADNDVIEKQPRGYRCKIYKGILDYIFNKFLENDEQTIEVLKSWSN